MKFIKYPLKEAHKPLPTVFMDKNLKEVIRFEKEIYVNGESGELHKALVFETNDKDLIKLIADKEKELSAQLTQVKRAQMRKRMMKFRGKENATGITEQQIARINIKCEYARGEANEAPQQREVEAPTKAVR